MNEEFIEHVERELRLLYEDAKDFATEYPGVVDRLGDLSRDKIDPGIARLLEGSAYLAARVQLKLQSEFSEFTIALLDQLLPNYLAPVASSVMVRALPPFGDPNLAKGITFPRNAILDATFIESERRVSCRYRLVSPLTLWPLAVEHAAYLPSKAPLQGQGLETLAATEAGLRLTLKRRTTAGANDPGAAVNELPLDTLPVVLSGDPIDVNDLYEMIFARRLRMSLRYLDPFGNPRFIQLRPDQIEQIGFDAEPLYPADNRSFAGFDLLRDYCIFPHKYAGFRLVGLRDVLAKVPGHSIDLLIEFDRTLPRLATRISQTNFNLYAVPATNLFAMDTSRVPITPNAHEHHIVPDRSRWMEFEIHRVLDVHAHMDKTGEKVPVYPLYDMPSRNERLQEALYYTIRRLPRRLTTRERRASRGRYVGSDVFISIYQPDGRPGTIKELSVRALVSNRHLPDDLPIRSGSADFLMADETALPLAVVAGPTKVRESPVVRQRRSADGPPTGRTMWQLINLLSLNHLGLTDRGANGGALALREILALFANLSDAATERQLRGIERVETRPVVRRLAQPNGFNAARGIEVTVTFDESAFEGTGIMLLAATLDRFLAEYSTINSFTQTVIASVQRGVIMRWPPRTGLGALL
ncbi:type VI secretion system baseplate subunit TssF [Nostoc sp. 3335mG]|nr:type VI secretion system baseplate subunit TssF [Nostoc sp. 3335mG]